MADMTIASALKELKNIDNKIQARTQKAAMYCMGGSTQIPEFGDAKKQHEKVASFIQSVNDLIKRKMELKQAVERANLTTKITFCGREYTLREILLMKEGGKKGRSGFDLKAQLFGSLRNVERQVTQQIQNANEKMPGDVKRIEPVRYFDLEWLNAEEEKLAEMRVRLDDLIESANFTTTIGMEQMSEEG